MHSANRFKFLVYRPCSLCLNWVVANASDDLTAAMFTLMSSTYKAAKHENLVPGRHSRLLVFETREYITRRLLSLCRLSKWNVELPTQFKFGRS
jgi:hypothetical protein